MGLVLLGMQLESTGQEIVVNLIEQLPACNGSSSGILHVEIASEGGLEYEFSWSNGSTDTRIENLSPGVYTLTIIDSRGCNYFYQYEVVGTECTVNIEVSPRCSVFNVNVEVLSDGEVVEEDDIIITNELGAVVASVHTAPLPDNSSPIYLYRLHIESDILCCNGWYEVEVARKEKCGVSTEGSGEVIPNPTINFTMDVVEDNDNCELQVAIGSITINGETITLSEFDEIRVKLYSPFPNNFLPQYFYPPYNMPLIIDAPAIATAIFVWISIDADKVDHLCCPRNRIYFAGFASASVNMTPDCGYQGLTYCPSPLAVNEAKLSAGQESTLELAVLGDCECGTTTDLRGLYINDNDGYILKGQTTGDSILNGNLGALQFADSYIWSQVPAGSLIVIGKGNGEAGFVDGLAPDTLDVDGDGVYVIDIDRTKLFLEREENFDPFTGQYKVLPSTKHLSMKSVDISNTFDGIQILDGNFSPVSALAIGGPDSEGIWYNDEVPILDVPEAGEEGGILKQTTGNFNYILDYEIVQAESASFGSANSEENAKYLEYLRTCESTDEQGNDALVSGDDKVPSNADEMMTSTEGQLYAPLGTARTPEGLYSSVEPNPFQDQLFVRLRSEQTVEVEISLVDIRGQRVGLPLAKVTSESSIQRIELTFPDELAPGVYLLRLRYADGNLMTHKVVNVQ